MPIRPPTHRARGLARQQAVLQAAVEVIAESGLEGVTHRAVAQRADVSLSTTSYFFASIDDLISAAVRMIADNQVSALEQLLAETTAGSKGGLDLGRDLDRFVRHLMASRPHDVIVQFEAYLGADHRPELRAAVQQIISSLVRVTQVTLDAAGVEESATLAREVVALLDGFALHRIAWPRQDSDEQALAAALRRLLRPHLASH